MANVHNPLGEVLLNSATAPTTPAAGKVYLYIDSADGLAKLKFPSGNVVVIPDSAFTIPTAGGGVTAVSAIGSSANANAATITGSTLNLEPASASFGGVMTTGTQTLAGAKTFSTSVTSPIHQSNAANPASLGEVRLGTTERIAWRNQANTADLTLQMDNNDRLQTNTDIVLPATKRFYLDGGGDSYVVESSSNVYDFIIGGLNPLFRLSTAGVAVPSGYPIYFDGGTNTYISNASDGFDAALTLAVGSVPYLIPDDLFAGRTRAKKCFFDDFSDNLVTTKWTGNGGTPAYETGVNSGIELEETGPGGNVAIMTLNNRLQFDYARFTCEFTMKGTFNTRTSVAVGVSNAGAGVTMTTATVNKVCIYMDNGSGSGTTLFTGNAGGENQVALSATNPNLGDGNWHSFKLLVKDGVAIAYELLAGSWTQKASTMTTLPNTAIGPHIEARAITGTGGHKVHLLNYKLQCW